MQQQPLVFSLNMQHKPCRMLHTQVMLPAGGPDAADFAAFVRTGVTSSFSDDDLTALLAPRGSVG